MERDSKPVEYQRVAHRIWSVSREADGAWWEPPYLTKRQRRAIKSALVCELAHRVRREAGPFGEHGEHAFSLYGHLSAMQVAQGERIASQATLGRSGLNPNGTPALYFELRVDGKPADPLQWLQKGTP